MSSAEQRKEVAGANKQVRLMPSGMHHLALFTHDMKKTVEFYERALGMRMRGCFPMHGFPGAKHCFLEGGNGFELSFVQLDDANPPMRAAELGRDIPHAGQVHLDDGRPALGGTLFHIALRCRDVEELKALRKQVRNAGVPISGIVDHGSVYSCYFQDPNGFQLELSTTVRPFSSEELQPELLDRAVQKDDVTYMATLAKL
mmetsp:Transcript_13209/g.31045  ORF Transcript_13209/g.31045 Transcript_13209/m.31045 type:complete len:201 (+) Transcript_13209:38-640(+)